MKNFPKTIYVSLDEDSGALAWETLEEADSGKIGIYTLSEEVETRRVVEVKKKGTKKWFSRQNS